jgi:hypothetical protein
MSQSRSRREQVPRPERPPEGAGTNPNHRGPRATLNASPVCPHAYHVLHCTHLPPGLHMIPRDSWDHTPVKDLASASGWNPVPPGRSGEDEVVQVLRVLPDPFPPETILRLPGWLGRAALQYRRTLEYRFVTTTEVRMYDDGRKPTLHTRKKGLEGDMGILTTQIATRHPICNNTPGCARPYIGPVERYWLCSRCFMRHWCSRACFAQDRARHARWCPGLLDGDGTEFEDGPCATVVFRRSKHSG